MVRPGGKVIVAHPRGAAHVAMQHRRSPEMVPRALPTAADLESQLCGGGRAGGGGGGDEAAEEEEERPGTRRKRLRLQVAPAPAGSPEDNKNGYLAVLEAYLD